MVDPGIRRRRNIDAGNALGSDIRDKGSADGAICNAGISDGVGTRLRCHIKAGIGTGYIKAIKGPLIRCEPGRDPTSQSHQCKY